MQKKRLIDLGTDARTLPTERMWEAMKKTDPSIAGQGNNAVEAIIEKSKEVTGKDSAILLPSCTMANLIALIVHTSPGDQVILEESSHIACLEGWGVCSVAGLFPKLIKGHFGKIGNFDLINVIKDERFFQRPASTLLCLENTHNAGGGTVLTASYTQEICDVARAHGLTIHLDGSRIFNASVALKTPVKELVAPVHSVAFNLNKGLSAPEGAMLCGSASFIQKAVRIARSLGGGSMHNSAMIAAAGLIAMDEMSDRLSEDHRRAGAFATAIQRIPGVHVDLATVQTNIVMADISRSGMDGMTALHLLKKRNVLAHLNQSCILRFVFHRHITDEDVLEATAVLGEVLSSKSK